MTHHEPTNPGPSDDPGDADRFDHLEPSTDGGPAFDSDFEQHLKALHWRVGRDFDGHSASELGPPTLRRDRLIYECGYAAGSTQSQAQLANHARATRRVLRIWQGTTVCATFLAVMLVIRSPQLERESVRSPAENENTPQLATQINSPDQEATAGRASVPGSGIPRSAQSPDSYFALRFNLKSGQQPGQPTPVVPTEVQLKEPQPSLRITDFHRLMDEG